ncbi:hypothetical protein [Paenibacillus sp. NEAU-GSW1]|uniref:hypothetical protein n=1 Tax=Paenibacillus sp. NEAU-GSW1 TaxID=2682486 RepID=UPI0012E21132|nr:hypothetical protein [Paenibacillus sp. NEAU-GSW1]MUT66274.1 hypothetical protein [Paenibacillus sp. NEAU-GSW1]
MSGNFTPEQLRETVEKLFRDAGYALPELLAEIELLSEQNEKLKQELKKLRLSSTRSASAGDKMNSRLKDALRE